MQFLLNLLEKIAYYQSRIDGYEQKYGLKFNDFRSRVVDKSDPILSRFGAIEKEDDDFEWETAIEFMQGFQEDLKETEL